MKTFIKAIFIVLFPLMLIACVITARGRHVTIRETYYYVLSTYNESVTTFLIDMETAQEALSNLDWELPRDNRIDINVQNSFQEKVESFLNGLNNTIRYIGQLISNVFLGLIHILGAISSVVVFILRFTINGVKVVLFFFGLIQ